MAHEVAKMRQNSGPQSSEKHVKKIRPRTQRKLSAEDQIRIVTAGLRGDVRGDRRTVPAGGDCFLICAKCLEPSAVRQ